MTSPDDGTWWRGAAIYQIYPRSFADSDGDGVGDLPGITARLEHVASLGVAGVWLSPFFTSPMKDFGYDVADERGVDPLFGTLEDFDRLVARAHGLGLKVIIDQVYSHTSDQHRWFRESRQDRANPRADWYVWADPKPDGSPPNNWQSVFGAASWTWDGRRRQYYLHNFLVEQPDLNLHHPAVQDAQLDCARFWLDRGVDGFRLDAINFALHDPALTDNPPASPGAKPFGRPWDYQRHLHDMSQPGVEAFLERLRVVCDGYGDIFTVAEVAGPGPHATMRTYSAERRLSSAYGFDFLYAPALTPKVVADALQAWPDGGEGWPAWAFSNHDAPRAVSRWAALEDRDAAARLLMLLLVSLRGNIFLYEGEELGLQQALLAFEDLKDPEAIANWPLTFGRDGARTPMPWRADQPNAGFSAGRPWLPVPPDHAELAVDRQEGDPRSMLNLTRDLLRLRAGAEALQTGGLTVLEASERVLSFERRAPGQRLLCVFNLSTVPAQHDPAHGDWRRLAEVGDVGDGRLGPWSGFLAEAVT